jgi:hypothetical protein
MVSHPIVNTRQYSNILHSHNSTTVGVETRLKFIEHRGWEILREDVNEL